MVICVCCVTDLPHTNDGVSDENKQNDKGLNECSDGFLSFLKPSQNLHHTKREMEGEREREGEGEREIKEKKKERGREREREREREGA